MARLDKAVREALIDEIRPQLPPAWAVSSGAGGHAWLQVDQDGGKPDQEFHKVGTHVIVAQNAKGARVEAVLYERVRFPPGYTEARKKVDSVCVVMGRGWKKALIEAVVARAFSAQEEYDTKIAARAARATKRK